MSLLASVVSPLGGRKAQGEEGRIWLKLAKQAEQKVRGTLEDLQKTMERSPSESSNSLEYNRIYLYNIYT